MAVTFYLNSQPWLLCQGEAYHSDSWIKLWPADSLYLANKWRPLGFYQSVVRISQGQSYVISSNHFAHCVASGGSLTIQPGGQATYIQNIEAVVSIRSNTLVNSVYGGGSIILDSGGSCKRAEITGTGSFTVGGTVDWISVRKGALTVTGVISYLTGTNDSALTVQVLDGGVISKAYLSYSNSINVSSGASVDSITVNYGAYLYVTAGGLVKNVVENGGAVLHQFSNNILYFVPHSFAKGYANPAERYQIITVHSNTQMTGTIGGNQELVVYPEGKISSVSVVDSGVLVVKSGGYASSVMLNGSSARAQVDTNGNIERIYLAQGCLTIRAGGSAEVIRSATISSAGVIKSAGSLYIYVNSNTVCSIFNGIIISDGITSIALRDGDRMQLLSGAVGSYNHLRSANLFINSGALAQGPVISQGGSLVISSGGTAASASVSSGGSMFAYKGGFVRGARVSAGARLDIYSGAYYTNVTTQGTGAIVSIYGGAISGSPSTT